MKINPYLIFNGDCRAAFTFYEQCLQGKLEAIRHAGGSFWRVVDGQLRK